MSKPNKKEVIETLTLQKEIFGDELFISKKKRNTSVVKEPSSIFEEPALFEEVKEDWEKATSLNQLEKQISNCTKCRLHQGRNKFVFGTIQMLMFWLLVKVQVLKRISKVCHLLAEQENF
jgi:hypothetical protein